MNDKQPEALLLAEMLECLPLNLECDWKIAAELRRLHTLNAELVGALQFILAFYEPGQTYLDTEAWKCAEASGRAALAKATGAPR